MDISRKTCIKFVKREQEVDFIEFVYSKRIVRSHIGRIGGKQEIYVTKSVREFKVVHEVMHTLGFWHEHQRPDRDDHIQIFEDNIIPKFRNQFDKFRPDDWEKNYRAYDFDSILHFSSRSFALPSKLGLPSLRKLDGSMIPTNKRLSKGDILLLNTFYPCECRAYGVHSLCEIPVNQ